MCVAFRGRSSEGTVANSQRETSGRTSRSIPRRYRIRSYPSTCPSPSKSPTKRGEGASGCKSDGTSSKTPSWSASANLDGNASSTDGGIGFGNRRAFEASCTVVAARLNREQHSGAVDILAEQRSRFGYHASDKRAFCEREPPLLVKKVHHQLPQAFLVGSPYQEFLAGIAIHIQRREIRMTSRRDALKDRGLLLAGGD